MLKSPRVFELNSENSRIHAKIKSERTVQVKRLKHFREPEHHEEVTAQKRFGNPPFLVKRFGV